MICVKVAQADRLDLAVFSERNEMAQDIKIPLIIVLNRARE